MIFAGFRQNCTAGSRIIDSLFAEGISIAIMELVMNWVDYLAGGVHAGSVFEPIFWFGLLVSIPPAFLAAWPVNHWLLKKELRVAH